jgi:hypothetical protein
MPQVLGWVEGGPCALGVAASLAFVGWWIWSFFQKQRELNAIDAEARDALKDAASGLKETAAAQKEMRETERQQFEADIGELKTEFEALRVELQDVQDIRAREAALMDWIVNRSVDHVLEAGEEADVFGHMLLAVASVTTEQGQTLTREKVAGAVVQIVELAGAAFSSHGRCTSAICLGQAILKSFRKSPHATFDQLFGEAEESVRARRELLMPTNLRVGIELLGDMKKP